MRRAPLLVELSTEELPPKALYSLGRAFAGGLSNRLQSRGLVDAEDLDTGITIYATPRRLGARIAGVLDRAPDRLMAQRLMPVKVGLDNDGRPTPALLKRLATLGFDEGAAGRLRREGAGKDEALVLDTVIPGVPLFVGLQQALDETLADLPIPKLMSYQLDDGWSTVKFARPAHGLVALHGDTVVEPLSALGLAAGRTTRGHRFDARVDPIVLQQADDYAERLLAEGAVVASFEERRAAIERQLADAAREAGDGLVPIDDPALLDEVTALVERPNVLCGRFDPAFLEVPPECLILTMKVNQKYFPLLDATGRLTHRFLLVSNVRPEDPAAVIAGNERVVRPRLADAKFFFEQDRKRKLEERVEGLKRVVYHARFGDRGSQYDRVGRVSSIAAALAEAIGADMALRERIASAAQLAKADLLTDMVGEFPELQGTMGRYYAQHEGLSDEVAYAIEDHYRPRFAGDALPRNATGTVLALADKLETLVGLFGAGEAPTGDKDPFALRRHALGVVRLLAESAGLGGLTLDRAVLMAQTKTDWPLERRRMVAGSDDATVPLSDALIPFIRDRLVSYLRESGYENAEIASVTSDDAYWRSARLQDVPKRLAAVRDFAALPESASLAAANKRVGNILRRSDADGFPSAVDQALFVDPAESALHAALEAAESAAGAAFAAGDFTGSLQLLAALKAPVDAFFDGVMVNVEEPALRANRIALLQKLHAAMNRVADLSKLAR